MAYATTNDLALYLGSDAPANADYLLELATDIVDELLIGVVYDVDDNDWPTDEDVLATLVKATCAQAAYMQMVGDPTNAQGAFTSVKIGEVSATRASAGGSTSQSIYAPNALRVLRVAGLKPQPFTWG